MLSPADPQDILDLGIHGIAMSRFSGLWVGMKIATNLADGSATTEVAADRVALDVSLFRMVWEDIQVLANAPDAGVVLLENLRFHAGEEKNDSSFAAQLAALADVYVNDAFGAAHRAHASVEAIVGLVSDAGAGLLMEKELRYLGEALENPEHPFVAILGGAKVSDKIEVIENLVPRVDRLIIGGAMAYTFFKAMGKPVGRSLVEDDKVELASQLMAAHGRKIVLPVDHVAAADRRTAHGGECEKVQDQHLTSLRRNAANVAWLAID